MGNNIKKYAFKPTIRLQLEVLTLETLIQNSQPHIVNPHRTNFYHVFLFGHCSPTHLVDFVSIKIQPFTLLFIDKDRVHQFDWQLDYKGLLLIFTEEFFCTNQADITFLKSTPLFNNTGRDDDGTISLNEESFDKFTSICTQINEELLQEADGAQPIILQNLLHNFLLHAEREKAQQNPALLKNNADLNYTVLFKHLLEKHYAERKPVSFYAEKLHISEKRLGQATSKITGKPPKQIINERVVLEAKRLLVHGNDSVKEIGFALGFGEPTNFIKYFKKHGGKTPFEFREGFPIAAAS